MDGYSVASDQVIGELIGMGFEFSDVTEAIKAVGLSLEAAIDFILNRSSKLPSPDVASSNCKYSTRSKKSFGTSALSCSRSFGHMRQLSIMEQLQSAGKTKEIETRAETDSIALTKNIDRPNQSLLVGDSVVNASPEMRAKRFLCQEDDIGPDWEVKVSNLLRKHFGYSSLKKFQKEALAAWLAHQDCLVLSATGSGKSLCFQIPALLTGKVVVVISPLISLMRDQCLKLAKHGVSACFLGSGQTDSSVERKAMKGMYDIIYVCPETILRLMSSLQSLAEIRGIALFAIDEVHCVSKWGHDFRPDYRRLSVLRENFSAEIMKFLKFDIPLMALTATATIRVREDIVKSLCMSNETKIVVTSFFRPNLRFSVKHSRTSSPASYERDFQELIDLYTRKTKSLEKTHSMISEDNVSGNSSSTSSGSISETDEAYHNEDDRYSEDDDKASSTLHFNSKQRKLSVEFLEDECDFFPGIDDLDVSCGEFYGESPTNGWDPDVSCENYELADKPEEQRELLQKPVEDGPTLIYVPTRKETLRIAKFLCGSGVKAAAYNANLPKSHLHQVHKDFHENALQAVVATIAFGMGIDKLNVRRIIHYGWPQSLEAYYQEAGRAGRDGKLADCVLYADLSRIPTLLPSQRSEEQTKHAYKMLSDCFRYGMCTSRCRAKTLVEYFGEDFTYGNCLLCDVCVNGPPQKQDVKAEADVFMQVIAAHYRQSSLNDSAYDDAIHWGSVQGRSMVTPNIRMLVSRIREQSEKYVATDLLWWRGLARVLEDKGFIKERDEMVHVQIKFPEPTKLGLQYLRSKTKKPFFIFPEADMLLSMREKKSYSTFSEWGKGWADPEIRHQRLERIRSGRKPRKRKSAKFQPSSTTVRGRLAAKLSKFK